MPRRATNWNFQQLPATAGAVRALVCVGAALFAMAIAPAMIAPTSSAAQAQTTAQTQAAGKAKKRRAARKAKPAAKAAGADPNGDAFPQGLAAAAAGRHDDAVTLLSAAIAGGKLKHRDLARALYMRGASYKATKKVALAIADLTNALYMRNGLTGEDRKQALALRAASYAEGGLSDQGQQDTASLPTTAPATSTRRAAASSPAAGTPANSPVGGAWRTSARPAAATPQPVPKASAPRTRTAVAPSDEAATATRTSWGGATTVATPAAETASPARRSGGRRVAAATPAAPAVAPKAVPKGLMIQAAAVRRQADAEAIAAKARAAGRREAYVDTAVMGNMGTFYRVLVGPFTKEADSRATCAGLRKSGLDCLMVRR